MSLISEIAAGLVSPITNAISVIWTKHEDTSLEKFKVDGQVDLSLVQAHISIIQAQAGLLANKWMVALQAAFALPLAFMYGKVHTWDAALHLGSTDAIKGDIATWDGWVMAFLFLHSAVIAWSRKT
jgi:hypothetical protein